VCFTDDDCYVASDFIDAILKAFEGWPQVGAIGGRILLHDPADARVTIDEREEPALYPTHTVLEAGQIQGANVSFRRRALEESGGFDPDLGAGTPFPAEDVDAVAAVMWAGFDVRYDPRPTVSHHHGRKDADIPVLMANYDAGRGAYWAKFILRPDTRVAYLRKWWSAARDQPETETLGRLNRELKSAFRYAALKRRYGSIAIAVPAAAAVIAFFALRSAAHAARPSLRSCRGSSHLL
jgi:GT2 family glycosyltransferase